MRKSPFLFFAAVLILNLLNYPIIAGDRMVFVERFTSWTCPPCGSNNPIMDDWLLVQDPNKVVGISYHMNWPAPGNDGFYLYNPGDNDGRRNYYGVNYIPQAKFDGIIQCDPPYSSYTLDSYFASRTDSLSPITIIITDSTFNNNNVTIKAIVFCEAPVQNPFATVQFAVVEKYKHYVSPPGTNGERDFYDIMRKMLPSSSGQGIYLMPGQLYNFQWTYSMDPVWQSNQIRNLIFVQSSTGNEILRAAVKTYDFTMLPNPAYKVVNQGQNQNASYKIKIPVVAPGYNSPVTFSAQAQPPVSGITTSFPSGNVLSNFPDSVTLQVSSTASVPTGAYRIVITGTNGAGKVHKTTVQYLVGETYISVGSNRQDLNLQFNVDGNTFNSEQVFTWNIGSQHLLEAISPQTQGSTRYVFQSWSDGGSSSHNVTVGTIVNSYTVNYKTQFKLITPIVPSGIPATISGGNTFYDSSLVANFSITPLVLQYQGQTWWFQNWTGQGNGSYTGNNPSPQVTMNNVIIETAHWDTIPPIGIKPIGNNIPDVFALHQNYPNPFNPSTQINFDLPKDGNISLKVYDILGNEVAVLFDGYKKAGYYKAEFSANSIGINFASGVYFYKLTAQDFTETKRMLLIK